VLKTITGFSVDGSRRLHAALPPPLAGGEGEGAHRQLGEVTLVTSRAFMNRLVALDNYQRTNDPSKISPMVIWARTRSTS